jgi:serine/threonine protein kinase
MAGPERTSDDLDPKALNALAQAFPDLVSKLRDGASLSDDEISPLEEALELDRGRTSWLAPFVVAVRTRVVKVATVPEQDDGRSLSRVSQKEQAAYRRKLSDLMKSTIDPGLQAAGTTPDGPMLQRIGGILMQQGSNAAECRDFVEKLFADVSGKDVMLTPNLLYLAHALLSRLDLDAGFSNWVQTQGMRIKSLEENVRAGYAELTIPKNDLDLLNLIQKTPSDFIDRHLREAFANHPDIDPTTINYVGQGGMALVVSAFSRSQNRHVALRFDLEILWEEKKGGTHAIRCYGLQERLFTRVAVDPQARIARDCIARSYGFDVVKLTFKNAMRVRPISIPLTYQVVELLNPNLALNNVLREQEILPPEKKTVLSTDAVLLFLGRISSALSYCHDMGIIHRDVKPENIIMTSPEGYTPGDFEKLIRQGGLRLIDFGLARDARKGDNAPTITTKTDTVGTLPYISPEGLSDGRLTGKPPNDVYSLCMLLFELITGQLSVHPLESQHHEPVVKSRGSTRKDGFKRQSHHLLYRVTIGQLDPEGPPVIDVHDPLLQPFIQKGGPIARKIVEVIAEGSRPGPHNRITMKELLKFSLAPTDYVLVKKASDHLDHDSDDAEEDDSDEREAEPQKSTVDRFIDWFWKSLGRG